MSENIIKNSVLNLIKLHNERKQILSNKYKARGLTTPAAFSNNFFLSQ